MAFLKILGFIIFLINFIWFVATLISGSMMLPDERKRKGINIIRKTMLISFVITSVWIAVILWVVM